MDKYRLRRLILDAVAAAEPGLATLDDIAAFPLLRMRAVQPERLLPEIDGLTDHGYLADLRPGRDPLLRITAKGRDQANQDSDLDEFIWGEMASRFKAL